MINKHENEKCGNVYTHTGFSLKPFDSKGFRFQRKFRLKEFSTLIIYRFPLLIDKNHLIVIDFYRLTTTWCNYARNYTDIILKGCTDLNRENWSPTKLPISAIRKNVKVTIAWSFDFQLQLNVQWIYRLQGLSSQFFNEQMNKCIVWSLEFQLQLNVQ